MSTCDVQFLDDPHAAWSPHRYLDSVLGIAVTSVHLDDESWPHIPTVTSSSQRIVDKTVPSDSKVFSLCCLMYHDCCCMYSIDETRPCYTIRHGMHSTRSIHDMNVCMISTAKCIQTASTALRRHRCITRWSSERDHMETIYENNLCKHNLTITFNPIPIPRHV